jgi:hypothetical protein
MVAKSFCINAFGSRRVIANQRRIGKARCSDKDNGLAKAAKAAKELNDIQTLITFLFFAFFAAFAAFARQRSYRYETPFDSALAFVFVRE